MRSLFITGASGFVGRHLMQQIDPAKYENVLCLSRRGLPAGPGLSTRSKVKLVPGSLFDTARYERELASAECVIHLAAATGKAPAEEHFRVNVEGTRTLTTCCRKLGVPRFLHVSSIAVRFPDKKNYYYAQSKERAEEIVRSSGLRYAIVRPTMIAGEGSPVVAGLSRLASLPIIPVFGDGRTLIQPIHVRDLVEFILLILDRDLFAGETFELGGPEVISIEDFLKQIRRRRTGAAPKTVHLSLGLLIPVLTLLEKLFYSLLPLTVGQLSSFRYAGTIEKNRLFEERLPYLKTTDEMLGSAGTDDAG